MFLQYPDYPNQYSAAIVKLSYLLLHHHLRLLSPEKNTTECHSLLQLLPCRAANDDPAGLLGVSATGAQPPHLGMGGSKARMEADGT